MTNLKYSLLGVLYSNHPRQESRLNLINLKFDTPASTSHAIDELIEAKLVKSLLGSDKIELTPSGAIIYESLNEVRNSQAEKAAEYARQNAEQKRQNRFLRITTFASLFIATITVVIALLQLILK